MNEEQADVFTVRNCYVNHLEGAYTYSRSTTVRDIVPLLSRIVQILKVFNRKHCLDHEWALLVMEERWRMKLLTTDSVPAITRTDYNTDASQVTNNPSNNLSVLLNFRKTAFLQANI